MALLGSSVDPRLFLQDYSGFTRAAEIQAQGMQNLGAAIGQGIKDFGEARQERKKLDAQIKADSASIESAVKLGDSLGIDIKSYLAPIQSKINDPNTTPMEAAAYGRAAAQGISNAFTLGIGAQERQSAAERAMVDAQYRMADLAIKGERLDVARMQAGKGPTPKFQLLKPQITSPTGEVFEGPELPYDENRGMFFDTKAQKYIADPDLIGTGKEYAPDSAMPTPTSQVGGGASDLISGAANGTFNISYKTRDLLPASSPTSRQISLDFNAAPSKNAKGIEIIIPNNATDEERQRAQEYVAKTKQYFAERGVNVPVRGVRTAKENGRGTSNRFHTEPFFVGDAASRAVMEKDPDGYAQVLASTLGRIPNAMFIPPHKSNDPGASDGKFNERDFAKGSIIPALERLSKQKSAQANPAGINNAISMTGDMTQQAMGTPEQQAMLSQQIEQGAGMAMAQNVPQGAMPTEPSMATQQPQLPQQAAPQWSPPKGFVPKQGKFRQFTPEEVTQYGSQGQVNVETGEVRPIRQPSGMVIEQTKDGGFRVVQGSGVGGRQEQATQAAKEQGVERATMGTQEIGRALEVLDSGVMQGSGPLASFYRAGAAKFIKGTPEYQLANNFIAPIKSMLAFNELNKMRMASPTGGALGNVAKFETDMLQQSAGQLDIDKTDPQTLRENLMRLQGKYLDVIHGTSEQRRKLLQDGKITKEQYFDIESSYPAFTMSEVGETVPRQIETVTPQAQESEADRILRELGE